MNHVIMIDHELSPGDTITLKFVHGIKIGSDLNRRNRRSRLRKLNHKKSSKINSSEDFLKKII